MQSLDFKNALAGRNYLEVENFIGVLSSKLVQSILRKNHGEVSNLRLVLSQLKSEISKQKENLLSSKNTYTADTIELVALESKVKQCSFIVEEYIKQEVSTNILEDLNELPYGYLILSIVNSSRGKEIDKASLVERTSKIIGEEIDMEVFNVDLEILEKLVLLKEEENILLTEKGENLFKIYSNNKKFTNKYESIQRKVVTQKRLKVDLELLEKIEKIQNAFGLLHLLFDNSEDQFTVQEVSELTSIPQNIISTILERLVSMQVVEGFEQEDQEKQFFISKYGKKIFSLYRESKKYTNKYESIKRKERQLVS